MKPMLSKFMAVIEVTFVAFAVVPLMALGIYRLFPRFQAWQTQAGFNVPIIFYAVAVLVPLMLAIARQKNPAEYGIDFHKPKYHLDILLACFLPAALISMLYAWVDVKSWSGALILIAGNVALLFVLAWLLRRKPAVGVAGALGAGLVGLPGLPAMAGSVAAKALVLFLNYAVFVGFGEEILFRGYIESRLNEVFSRPFRFFGVPFGWSVFITNLLFGLMHVGIIRWILGINYEVTLAWGFWTIFSGLVFSFVREKTGSILAPALLHGLPQAIAWVAMLFS